MPSEESLGGSPVPGSGVVRGERRHIDDAWGVIDRARAALLAAGIRQWEQSYPNRAGVERDVARGTLFVLETGGRCVACVTLDGDPDDAYATAAWTTPEPALIVHRLCVDPEAQGRGYSHLLMDFAERHAADNGYRSVRLDAFTLNPRSVALYRKRGYREAGMVFFPRRSDPFHLFEREMKAGRPR